MVLLELFAYLVVGIVLTFFALIAVAGILIFVVLCLCVVLSPVLLIIYLYQKS